MPALFLSCLAYLSVALPGFTPGPRAGRGGRRRAAGRRADGPAHSRARLGALAVAGLMLLGLAMAALFLIRRPGRVASPLSP